MTSEDNIVIRKWMVGHIITLGVAIGTGLIWATKISEDLEHLKQDMVELKSLVEVKTADRWYRSDAEREWQFHREREHDGLTPHNHIDDHRTRVSP